MSSRQRHSKNISQIPIIPKINTIIESTNITTDPRSPSANITR